MPGRILSYTRACSLLQHRPWSLEGEEPGTLWELTSPQVSPEG